MKSVPHFLKRTVQKCITVGNGGGGSVRGCFQTRTRVEIVLLPRMLLFHHCEEVSSAFSRREWVMLLESGARGDEQAAVARRGRRMICRRGRFELS